MKRRTFLRRGAAGAGGVAAAGVGADRAGLEIVDEADALAVTTLVAGAAVTGVAVGWALDEWDPLSGDSPPEGLTPGALKQHTYQTALTRKSTNASSILNTENLVQASKNDAYAKGKKGAIEALNDQLTESEVVTASHEAVDVKDATVTGNQLKTWNESVSELESRYVAASEHPDVNVENAIDLKIVQWDAASSVSSNVITGFSTRTIQLADGSDFDLRSIECKLTQDNGTTYSGAVDPLNTSYGTLGLTSAVEVFNGSGNSVVYLDPRDFQDVVNQVDTAYQEVRNGLSNYVSKVYDDVQSGELNPENLLTPSDLAGMMPDGEGYPQALADLMALGFAVDLERKMTIELSGIDATISGTMALSDTPAETLTSGNTIDPTQKPEDYYFTYDTSEGTGVWSDYETGVDGGIITFTSDPYADSVYTVKTAAGESVEIPASDFTETDQGGAWTYDASADLETAITDVDSVSFASQTEGTHFETIQLKQEFTIKKIENEETGETVDSTSFTQTKTQTDSNYITQDEWDQLQQQNQKLIEKYEKAKNDDGSLLGGIFGGSGGPGLLAMLAGLGGTATLALAAAGAYIVASD